MTDLRVQAEAERVRQQNLRLANEHAAGEQQRAEREFRRIAGGGETERQRRAAARISLLEVIGRGRWAPSNEAAASRGSGLDNGAALTIADQAASEAVVAALEPLLQAAQDEVRAVDAERLAIIERGHL